MRCSTCSVAPTFHGRRTFCALIVMPRSRSMSMRSRYWARIMRSSTTPVSWSIRSASVDLPWSMWAMMQKLRISAGSVCPGVGVARVPDGDSDRDADGDTDGGTGWGTGDFQGAEGGCGRMRANRVILPRVRDRTDFLEG